ncbi:hypothetical protein NECAME_10965 [Necator americanus]|uniref:Uncharacterized protein n=1 Tax=Necator americanus TaxID=51031 RepID=W2T8N1_NECAM|nr:hypothetical protein NECAME_10965 [Necator americanus]ETN77556.1 hypothetical protein NECAME_10965 [Necator americanus]
MSTLSGGCNGASQTGGYDYGNTYDQTYGQTYAYDQNDGYTNSTYPQADTSTYDQNAQQYYAGYDQQATYQYDETAQYAGYDQAAGGYEQQAQYYDTSAAQGNGYPDGSYHQTHAGYDQTAAEYSEPHIGCDQDHSVTPQPEEYNVAAPAPLGAEQQTAPTNYDYSQYSQSYATGYSAYQKDHAAQPYGGQVNVHNEVNANGPQPYSTEHDNSQTGPPQRPPPASVFTQPLFQRGSQGYSDNIAQREIHRLTEEMKQEKKLKKKLKQQGKKVASPTFDPDQEDSMDRAAQELAMKMANMRTDLADWKPPSETKAADEMEKNDSVSTIPP